MDTLFRRLACAAFSVSVLAGGAAQAQTMAAPRAPAPATVPQTTGQTGSSLIIDQNRADRRPPSTAPTMPAPIQGGAAAVAAQAITPFVLRGVRVEGGHAPPALVGAASRPFIGKTVDGNALAQIADAVSAAYADSDVALYTVVLPAQSFEGGIVTLRVVEGYVQTARVATAKGKGHASRGEIALARDYIRPLMAQRPLRKSSLQRALLLTRDMAGITADVQVLQARGGPGAVALVVTLSKRTLQVGVGINNRGTAELGRTQAEIDVTLNGLFRAGDQTRLTAAFPTDIDRFQYYAVSHSQLLNRDGLSLTGSLGYLRTRPLSYPIKGRAETAALALSYPLIRSNETNLVLTGSIDGVDSSNALFGQTISNERTRSLRGAASYSRAKGKSVFGASGTLSVGLDTLGARTLDPRISTPDYVKVNGRIGYDRQISPRWVVRLRGLAQYSGDRLPASEQVTLGGDEFGRGFVAASVVGDSGVAGSAEAAFLPTHLPAFAKGSELYAFVDGGKVWYHNRTIVPALEQSLASAGGGVRLALFSKTVLQHEAAKPIHADFPRYKDDVRFVASIRSLY